MSWEIRGLPPYDVPLSRSPSNVRPPWVTHYDPSITQCVCVRIALSCIRVRLYALMYIHVHVHIGTCARDIAYVVCRGVGWREKLPREEVTGKRGRDTNGSLNSTTRSTQELTGAAIFLEDYLAISTELRRNRLMARVANITRAIRRGWAPMIVCEQQRIKLNERINRFIVKTRNL